jgi:hypothetical protein
MTETPTLSASEILENNPASVPTPVDLPYSVVITEQPGLARAGANSIAEGIIGFRGKLMPLIILLC